MGNKDYKVLGLIAAIKQCGTKRDLQRGESLHAKAVETGYFTNKYVANTLINMYSKCGSMKHAHALFESMTHRDVVSWTNLIHGYVENGKGLVALDLFVNMNCEADYVTFVAALKACTGLAKRDREFCLERGMVIHRQAKELGFDLEIVVANTLIDMYSKCGSMQRARAVFDDMTERDVLSWTSLILGYMEKKENLVAMELFLNMDCEPDSFTYVTALKSCAGLAVESERDRQFWLNKGMAIHCELRRRGFDSDVYVASSLVELYSKCGCMQQAQAVFDKTIYRDVVLWTSLILGYFENGESSVALDFFSRMTCEPDSVTYVAALKAALADKSLEKGLAIHGQARECGLDKDIAVANTLIELYSKCNSMIRAWDVFVSMIQRDVLSWTTLIIGYVENGESSVALELFVSMDCEPDSITYAAVLKACGSLPAQALGQSLHAQCCKLGMEQVQVVATTLVDFYGKCGEMGFAEHVFNSMHSRDSVSWSVLISGYSSMGNTSQVFSLVHTMRECSIQMDDITVMLILTGCSRAGTVEEGLRCFQNMFRYGISPTMEHYHCVIDMLGKANRLQEALHIVQSMPFQANHVAWTTLLGACRNYNNLEIAKVAYDALVARDIVEAAPAYVLMGEIYKNLGMPKECEHVEAYDNM